MTDDEFAYYVLPPSLVRSSIASHDQYDSICSKLRKCKYKWDINCATQSEPE